MGAAGMGRAHPDAARRRGGAGRAARDADPGPPRALDLAAPRRVARRAAEPAAGAPSRWLRGEPRPGREPRAREGEPVPADLRPNGADLLARRDRVGGGRARHPTSSASVPTSSGSSSCGASTWRASSRPPLRPAARRLRARDDNGRARAGPRPLRAGHAGWSSGSRRARSSSTTQPSRRVRLDAQARLARGVVGGDADRGRELAARRDGPPLPDLDLAPRRAGHDALRDRCVCRVGLGADPRVRTRHVLERPRPRARAQAAVRRAPRSVSTSRRAGCGRTWSAAAAPYCAHPADARRQFPARFAASSPRRSTGPPTASRPR